MPGHECYHCKQWVEEGEAHDCWTTTEAALTRDLSEDLRDAYARLREAAADLGEQRIYASHHCIMFARKACYFFVRPKRDVLELSIFLGRAVKAPQVRRVERKSKAKLAHIIQVRHRDEVEAPITDWLQEAYDLPDRLAVQAAAKPAARRAAAAPKRAPAKPAGSAKRAKPRVKKTNTRSNARPAARKKRGARRPGRR